MRVWVVYFPRWYSLCVCLKYFLELWMFYHCLLCLKVYTFTKLMSVNYCSGACSLNCATGTRRGWSIPAPKPLTFCLFKQIIMTFFSKTPYNRYTKYVWSCHRIFKRLHVCPLFCRKLEAFELLKHCVFAVVPFTVIIWISVCRKYKLAYVDKK